jgi:RNA-directed DNA polymerase
VKAKAEPSWRFWGLSVHVCTRETLREAYRMAKANNGAPGLDGVTVEDIEASGVAPFLEQLRDALVARTYHPMRVRRKARPKDGGTKVRVLGMPTIRDRVVQGALKLILAPGFEADVQPGAYGYRPQRSAHAAVERVAEASVSWKTRVIDVDLQGYCDHSCQHVLVAKVAQRINDAAVMHLLKGILKASGRQGVPQGGVISPWLSKLYRTEVDRRLERAKEMTRHGK